MTASFSAQIYGDTAAADLPYQPEEGAFEWTAVMLNINYGKNEKLLKECEILREYAILVDTIRKYRQEADDLETAVIMAVDECIRKDILGDFLLKNKAEVVDMCLTEYDEEETMQMFKEEAMAKGFAEGEKRGRTEGEKLGEARGRAEGEKLGEARGEINTLLRLAREGLLSKEEAAKQLNLTPEQLEKKLQER